MLSRTQASDSQSLGQRDFRPKPVSADKTRDSHGNNTPQNLASRQITSATSNC